MSDKRKKDWSEERPPRRMRTDESRQRYTTPSQTRFPPHGVPPPDFPPIQPYHRIQPPVMPPPGFPPFGVPLTGHRSHGFPPQGHPPPRFQLTGHRSQGFPQTGHQSQGFPRTGYQSQGFPPPSMPSQSYPLHGIQQSGPQEFQRFQDFPPQGIPPPVLPPTGRTSHGIPTPGFPPQGTPLVTPEDFQRYQSFLTSAQSIEPQSVSTQSSHSTGSQFANITEPHQSRHSVPVYSTGQQPSIGQNMDRSVSTSTLTAFPSAPSVAPNLRVTTGRPKGMVNRLCFVRREINHCMEFKSTRHLNPPLEDDWCISEKAKEFIRRKDSSTPTLNEQQISELKVQMQLTMDDDIVPFYIYINNLYCQPQYESAPPPQFKEIGVHLYVGNFGSLVYAYRKPREKYGSVMPINSIIPFSHDRSIRYAMLVSEQKRKGLRYWWCIGQDYTQGFFEMSDQINYENFAIVNGDRTDNYFGILVHENAKLIVDDQVRQEFLDEKQKARRKVGNKSHGCHTLYRGSTFLIIQGKFRFMFKGNKALSHQETRGITQIPNIKHPIYLLNKLPSTHGSLCWYLLFDYMHGNLTEGRTAYLFIYSQPDLKYIDVIGNEGWDTANQFVRYYQNKATWSTRFQWKDHAKPDPPHAGRADRPQNLKITPLVSVAVAGNVALGHSSRS